MKKVAGTSRVGKDECGRHSEGSYMRSVMGTDWHGEKS